MPGQIYGSGTRQRKKGQRADKRKKYTQEMIDAVEKNSSRDEEKGGTTGLAPK